MNHEPFSFFLLVLILALGLFLYVMWSYSCKITKTVHFDPSPSQERVSKNLHGSDINYDDGDLKSFRDLKANVFIIRFDLIPGPKKAYEY